MSVPAGKSQFGLRRNPHWVPFIVTGVIGLTVALLGPAPAAAADLCQGLFDGRALSAKAISRRELVQEAAQGLRDGVSALELWTWVRMSPKAWEQGWRSTVDYAEILKKAEAETGLVMKPSPADVAQKLEVQLAHQMKTDDVAAVHDEIEMVQAWLSLRQRVGVEKLRWVEAYEVKVAESMRSGLSKERRNAIYAETLRRATEQEPDLLFNWRVNRPEDPVLTDDGRVYMRPLKKNTIDYVGNPFEADAFHGVYRMMGFPHPTHGFYESVYRNYDGRIRDALIELVQRVEDKLPTKRQGYGSVIDPVAQKVIGTLRVSDGTPLRPYDPLWIHDFEPAMSMPFEAIFEERGVDFAYKKELQQIRRENHFQHLFEMGKFSLDEKELPGTRNRARKVLELFVLDYYVKRYPDAIFHAHVASEEHLRLYEMRYGFSVKEKILIPNPEDPENPRVEYILTQTAEGLGKKLRARLGLK